MTLQRSHVNRDSSLRNTYKFNIKSKLVLYSSTLLKALSAFQLLYITLAIDKINGCGLSNTDTYTQSCIVFQYKLC